MLMDEFTYKVSTELIYTVFALYVIFVIYIKKKK
jgi:hypothetical protein